jgi:hypothetical protein
MTCCGDRARASRQIEQSVDLLKNVIWINGNNGGQMLILIETGSKNLVNT